GPRCARAQTGHHPFAVLSAPDSAAYEVQPTLLRIGTWQPALQVCELGDTNTCFPTGGLLPNIALGADVTSGKLRCAVVRRGGVGACRFQSGIDPLYGRPVQMLDTTLRWNGSPFNFGTVRIMGTRRGLARPMAASWESEKRLQK